jgi:hypothetical protein
VAQAPARNLLGKMLEPTATTDADGVARFINLAPGLWNVTAESTVRPNTINRTGSQEGSATPEFTFGSSEGVIVDEGPPRTFTTSLYPQDNGIAFQILAPNGQPPSSLQVDLEYGQAAGLFTNANTITLDKQGNGKYDMYQPGLWRIVTRFWDVPIESLSAYTEPYDESSAVFAVSPALPDAAPVVIHTILHETGSIRVRILDSAGHPPQRGTVFIGDPFDSAKYAASLDANGEAVFPEMPSGKYLLRANFAGQPAPPALGQGTEPFPKDTVLKGVTLLVPQTVGVSSGTETLATFRPQLQGYVRGRVIAPDLLKNYQVYYNSYLDIPPSVRYDPKTGEYIIGPLPPGKAAIRVQRSVLEGGDWNANGRNIPVEVKAGQVTRLNLTAPPPPPSTATVENPDGIFSSNNENLSGVVLLSDGKTPAWGAQVALVTPQTGQPEPIAQTDARGRLFGTNASYPLRQMTSQPPGSPTRPVLVAWLPGQNGATVVPYDADQAAHLVLPAPETLHGRVTVAGESVAGMHSRFQIQAAYQGRGNLNSLLSVEATAQADGTFDLAGLTPGTYRVQAARDGIWLSETQTVTVGADPLPNLTLNIAPAGAPVTLRLVDRRGQSLPNEEAALSLPAGPLTDTLWPKTFTTDGAGELHLEGLTAGQHALLLTQPHKKAPFILSFPVPVPSTDASAAAQTLVVP